MKRKKRTSPRPVERPVPPGLRLGRNWLLGFILGLTFLGFSNCITNGFAYDDTTQILSNQFIRDFGNLPKALVTEAWYWRVQLDQDPNEQDKPSTPYYRPIFTIYLMILWKLFGAWAPGWHLLNIAVHMLAVYLVFLVIERIAKDSRISAIGSLVFALHPLRSESVAWISGVTDPILAVFLIGSFYFYIRYRDEGEARLLIYSLVLFVFAAFSKEPAVALPIVIGAYELFVINQDEAARERIRWAAKYSACFLLVSGFYFLARYFALGFTFNNSNFKHYPTTGILLTIPLVIWKYILLLVWPVDLSLFHATPILRDPLALEFILPFVGLLALSFGLWQLRGSIVARFAILWFATNLLPVLNLSAFAEDFLVQERYVYVPSIGFALLLAIAIAKVPIEEWLPLGSRSVARTAFAGLLVLLLAGKSFAQNTAWKDERTLWSHGVETASEQSMSHFILGHHLLKAGQYNEAAEELTECLKRAPDNLIVISNLASTYVILYQTAAGANPGAADASILDRALELCEKGLAIQGDFPALWDTLGTIHTFDTVHKNYDRAIACFQRGLGFSPGNAMITFHLGGTLTKKGDLENGMRLLQSALEMDPRIIDIHKFLAHAYQRKGQLKEAIAELSIYLNKQPNAPDATRLAKDLQDLRAQLQASTPQS
jgi:tetratricopeptide (TPR) repeat protein